MRSSSASTTPVVRCGASASRSPSPSPSLALQPFPVPYSTCTAHGRPRLTPSTSVDSLDRLESDALRVARSLAAPPRAPHPVRSLLQNSARLTSTALPTEDPQLTTPCLRTAVAEVLGFVVKQVAAANIRPVSHPSAPLPSSTGAAGAVGGAALGSFDFRADRRPSVSLETYIFMWVCQCDCDVELCVAALILLDRVATVLPLTPHNCHRLWAAAMVAALKTYDDFAKTNKRYAQIAGVPLAELNTLERHFLAAIDFALVISAEEWAAYCPPLHRLVVVQYTQGLCLFLASCCRTAALPDEAPPAPQPRRPRPPSQPRRRQPPTPRSTPPLPPPSPPGERTLATRIRDAFSRFFA